jgi:Spy/CpxP family protein refolding chaperone
MIRWTRKTVLSVSIAGVIALVPCTVALAQQAKASHQEHEHARRAGLLGEALKLASLNADQRAAIQQLIDQRQAATAPVRAADAQVLTALAQEVEQASIDRQALAPALSAEETAATAQSTFEQGALNRLHALLTPAQRSEVVDRLEAAHGKGDREKHEGHAGGNKVWGGKLGLTPDQKSQIAANLHTEQSGRTNDQQDGERRHQALEAFRGDSFDASALVHLEHRGERAEKLAQAMVPVLTPAQRATFAAKLRARAAHESRS